MSPNGQDMPDIGLFDAASRQIVAKASCLKSNRHQRQ
jgi:hypothetical protein